LMIEVCLDWIGSTWVSQIIDRSRVIANSQPLEQEDEDDNMQSLVSGHNHVQGLF
jgi:hypothetical protein